MRIRHDRLRGLATTVVLAALMAMPLAGVDPDSSLRATSPNPPLQHALSPNQVQSSLSLGSHPRDTALPGRVTANGPACPYEATHADGCFVNRTYSQVLSPATPEWRNVSAESNQSPQERTDTSMMAYDPAANATILFGGLGVSGGLLVLFGDTWAFASGNWTELRPNASPAARSDGAMIWDGTADALLLFGGEGSAGPLNDTWEFANGNWTQIASPSSPSARWGMSLAWNSSGGYVLMFGGQNNTGLLNDTWTFSAGQWHEMTSVGAPGGREYYSMGYDPSEGAIILFGGVGSGDVLLNDTWWYAGNRWTEASSAMAPPARDLAQSAFFPPLGSWVLYGGIDKPNAPFLSDVWWYADGRWSNQTTNESAGARVWGSLAYSPACDCLLSFGGSEGPTTFAGGTWEYYVLNLTLTVSPPVGEAPLAVKCEVYSSNDALPIDVTWSFGDGTYGTGDSVEHTYQDAGTFTIEVNASDTNGARSSLTGAVTVLPRLVVRAVAAPLEGPSPLNVTVAATAVDGAAPYTFAWSLDGTEVSSSPATNVTVASIGDHVLSIRCEDDLGYSVGENFSLAVSAPAPPPLALQISANRTNGPTPLSIEFSAASIGGFGQVQVNWTFGDGGSGQGPAIAHTFEAAGSFEVHATAMDALGTMASANLSVTAWAALTVNITSVEFSSDNHTAPVTVHLMASSSGGAGAVIFFWNFSDGEYGEGSAVSHTFSIAGNFSVSVEALDGVGDRARAATAVDVIHGAPASSSSVTNPGLSEYEFAVGTLIGGFVAGAAVAWLISLRSRRPPAPPPP